MKRANRLMLVVGVALAALSFVAVLALGGFGQGPAQATPPPNVPVLVAATDLALGTQVKAEQLTTTTMSQSAAADTFSDPQQVVGQVVRRAVSQGSALTTADFQSTTTVPELLKSLKSGLRAIAVPLSSIDSVGALVQPGDTVDVLISLDEVDGLNPISILNPVASPSTDGAGADPYLSIDEFVNNTSVKVVVQNVQVLAAIAATPLTQDANSQATPAPDMVVLLAVTPQQAEVVRFAQLDGNISLVLRAPADATAPAVDTTGITLKELVDQYGVLPPAPVGPASSVAP